MRAEIRADRLSDPLPDLPRRRRRPRGRTIMKPSRHSRLQRHGRLRIVSGFDRQALALRVRFPLLVL